MSTLSVRHLNKVAKAINLQCLKVFIRLGAQVDFYYLLI